MFDNREKLENLAIFSPGGHNFDFSKKSLNSFGIIF